MYDPYLGQLDLKSLPSGEGYLEKENEVNSELKERKISGLTDEEKGFLYYEPYEYIKVVNIPQNETAKILLVLKLRGSRQQDLHQIK